MKKKESGRKGGNAKQKKRGEIKNNKTREA